MNLESANLNTKQTWWLTGAAVALFLFIVLFERRDSAESVANRTSTRLVPELRMDRVTGIEIREPDLPVIGMRKNGQFWMMESPVRYPVTVEPWLFLLERATWVIRLSPEELKKQGDDLSDFGLAPARLTVVLQSGDQKTEVRFGDKIPIGNRLYVQVGDQADVLVVDALLFDALPKSANGWRDPALVNYRTIARPDGGFELGRIEVRSPSQGVEGVLFAFQPDFKESAGSAVRWRLADPIDARADSDMVNSLLYTVAPGWVVEEYVSDDPKADVEKYGLLHPRFELAMMNGTNDLLSVQFGGSPTNRPDLVYARQVQFTNVVLTARSNIGVLQLPYTYWRNRRLISIDTNRVSEITGNYAFGDQVFTYRLASDTNHAWKMMEPENLPVDGELMDEFFQQMNTLRISAFEKDLVTDFAEYGLAVPARQFSFGISTNLANTNGYPTLSFGTNDSDQAFARRSDEIAVYSIDRGNFSDLPLTHWQWRDRNIWSFKTNEVKRVVIEQYGRKREVIRADDGGWLLAPGSTGVLDLSFEEAVYQLSKLKADRWVAKGGAGSAAQFGFSEPPHRVTFEVVQNGQTMTNSVAFGGLRDGIYPFASVTLNDNVTWYFDFPTFQYYPFVKSNFMLPKGE